MTDNVSRLKDKLYTIRARIIGSVAPEEFRDSLTAIALSKSDTELWADIHRLYDSIGNAARAKMAPSVPGFPGRCRCPLCGSINEDEFTDLSLRRHLQGTHNMSPCLVMEAATCLGMNSANEDKAGAWSV